MNAEASGGDDVSSLVFEFGSFTSKIGYSGEDCPRITFPSWAGVNNSWEQTSACNKQKCKFGESEISFWQENIALKNPFVECLVDDWEIFEEFIRFSYSALSANADEHPILLCDPPWNTHANREKSMEIFFEKFHSPAFFASANAVLSAFASGKPTALVLDFAHEFISSSPVIDGFVLKKNIARQPFAGKYLSEAVSNLLSSMDVSFSPQYLVRSKEPVIAASPAKATLRSSANIDPSFHSFALDREISHFKASILQFSDSPLSTLPPDFPAASITKNYEFPDGYNNAFGLPRLSIPESLFVTHTATPYSQPPVTPIPALIQGSVSSCDPDLIARLYPNIVVTGGSSLISGFIERLSFELNSITAGTKTRIHAPRSSSERTFSSWIGGSILSSLGTFHQLWISREEFLEGGTSALERRLF